MDRVLDSIRVTRRCLELRRHLNDDVNRLLREELDDLLEELARLTPRCLV